jgi:hypothetical protein
MTIKEYRQAILEILLNAKDKNGNTKMEESEARDILDSFSDIELEDGMDFNTPEDVADIILNE